MTNEEFKAQLIAFLEEQRIGESRADYPTAFKALTRRLIIARAQGDAS